MGAAQGSAQGRSGEDAEETKEAMDTQKLQFHVGDEGTSVDKEDEDV